MSSPIESSFVHDADGHQKYELGYKPSRRPILRSSYNGTVLEIEAGLSESETVSFSVPIKQPATPPKGKKKAAAEIAYGGTSVPVPAQVTTIALPVDTIAQQMDQSSRNNGVFYDLYGTPEGNSTAGTLMAWAWATSSIIDSLERHPEIGIDPAHIAVTGCSRNGKGAIVAGALD